MNLKTNILLLAGCVFYLESQKGSELIQLLYLLGSYIFIPLAVMQVSSKLFERAEKVKVDLD